MFIGIVMHQEGTVLKWHYNICNYNGIIKALLLNAGDIVMFMGIMIHYKGTILIWHNNICNCDGLIKAL